MKVIIDFPFCRGKNKRLNNVKSIDINHHERSTVFHFEYDSGVYEIESDSTNCLNVFIEREDL